MGFSRQQIVPVGDACEKTADAVALLKASACKFQHRDLSKRRQLLEMRGRQSRLARPCLVELEFDVAFRPRSKQLFAR